MIILLRLVFGVGLGVSLYYSVLYLIGGDRRHLTRALRVLLVTLVMAVIFFIGVAVEHLMQ
ncbi:MAG: hypothetical protein R3E87_10705 [Burkholderiaceae bacterium]